MKEQDLKIQPTFEADDLWFAPIDADEIEIANVVFPKGSKILGYHPNGKLLALVGNRILDKLGRHYPLIFQTDIPTNPRDPRRFGVSVGDVIEATHRWTDSAPNGGDFYSVWHYKVIAVRGGFSTMGQNYANYMAGLWNGTSLANGLDTQYGITTEYESIELTNLNVLTETVTFTISSKGTNATSMLAPRTAVVIQKRTVTRGRSNYGRAYLPRPTELSQQAGTLTRAAHAEFNNFGAGMINFAQTGNTLWQGVVLSRKLSTAMAFHTTNIDSIRTHNQLGSQRRRLKRLA